MTIEKKTSKILVGSFLIYAVLVATHLGEFWPFSIYPMFSQAGRPWTRSLVREVDKDSLNDAMLWKVRSFDDLPGTQIAMNDLGISQNDIANMVSKTKVWNEGKVSNLRTLFGTYLEDKTFLIYKVHGHKTDQGEQPVSIEFTPFTLLSPDTTLFNTSVNKPH